MKKTLIGSAILFIILLVLFAFKNGKVDAEATISENDVASKAVADALDKEYEPTVKRTDTVSSNDTVDVSDNDLTNDVSENEQSKNQIESSDTEDDCLYRIEATGNIKGLSKIISGQAFVFMQSDSVRTGDYDSAIHENTILPWSFYQNTTIEEYNIPSNIKLIDQFSFARSTLKRIQIPKGVQVIGEGAFYHCDNLEEVEIPATVQIIKPYAFDNTPWLEQLKRNSTEDFVVVGDGILLAYCGNEKRIRIPDYIKSIYEGAIPSDVTIIE